MWIQHPGCWVQAVHKISENIDVSSLTKVSVNPTREDDLLDLLLWKGVWKVRSALTAMISGVDNFEKNKTNRTAVMDFRIACISLFSVFLTWYYGRLPWKVQGLRIVGWSSATTSLIIRMGHYNIQLAERHGRRLANMNMELLMETKHKKEIYRGWKKVWAFHKKI